MSYDRERNTRNVRRYRARRAGKLALRTIAPYVHGERRTYIAGCRCADCRAAEALYRNQWRRTKTEISPLRHLNEDGDNAAHEADRHVDVGRTTSTTS